MAVISGARLARAPLLTGALATLIAAAMLLPLAYLVIRVWGAGQEAWDVISDSRTIETLVRTAWLALTVTVASVALAVPLAWLTVRTDLPFRSAWSVLLVLPLAIPSYVGAFAFVSALAPQGLIQDVLEPLGVDELPGIYGFRGAWLVLTLFTFPYVLLPVRATLRGIDPSFAEASRSLGKSAWSTFFRVTLPQLRPAIAAGALLVALYTLSDFGAVSILRFDSLTRVIYIQYTSAFDRTSAAALSLLLVALAMVVVVIEGATRGRARYYGSGRRGEAPPVALGKWRWPALAFCFAVVAIALALPLSVIGYWLVRGFEAGLSWDHVREAAVNSAYASSLAAVAAVLAALPVTVLVVRHRSVGSSLLEKATYTGFALPGIVIALALVFFASNYATVLYQTLALLVFAYVVRFLPEALGATRSALVQVNPSTEEAARNLGKRPWEVFSRITVPQMLPGISAGWILVFLTVMKELPVTLLLAPTDFRTLATEVWSASSNAFFAQAALPALILVAISAIPMFVTVLREREAA